ncbi:MAG: S1C family serine protease, partial [Bryobacteraceae bacterium]
MNGFGEVAERLRRSTVQVLDTREVGSGGSGIILDATGVVLTNAHVVRGTTAAEVKFWDGVRLPARILKHDHRRDLAILQVDTTGLPAASTASATAPRVGELAIAVGNPLGFIGALSTGVVHAVGPLPGLSRQSWLQTTVRLAPGSSGGPLANARGEVMGVNTMVIGMGAGGNLSLAIHIAEALRFLTESDESRAALGITVRPVPTPGERAPGFLMLEITPGSPAHRASLLAGDLLIGVNGRRFRKFSDLQEALDDPPAGPLSLQFRRGASLQHRTVTI